MIWGLVLDLGPHPEVIGPVAHHEVPGVWEQVQVVPDLSESVGAYLPGDAAVGDSQTQRIAEPLEELRVGAVGPVPHPPKVVPTGDAVARTADIDGLATCLEGGRITV